MILPSEKAFSYKMRLEAMNRQGQRTDLTCSPVGNKLPGVKSSTVMAEEVGESKNTIFRYIRLTELIPELLDLVDEGRIAFRPAVELSYLQKEEQSALLEQIAYADATPSLAQAINTKARISLDTGSNKVHWIYFNPDADAGGQYVSGDLDFSVFEELVEQYDIANHPENAADFRNDLEEMSDQFLADINTPFFMEAENDYEMDCDYIEFTPENLLKIHEDILSLEADRGSSARD